MRTPGRCSEVIGAGSRSRSAGSILWRGCQGSRGARTAQGWDLSESSRGQMVWKGLWGGFELGESFLRSKFGSSSPPTFAKLPLMAASLMKDEGRSCRASHASLADC